MNEIKEDSRKGKKEKERSKLGKMLSRRVYALGLGLWSVGMALITWAVAEDMLSQVVMQTKECAVGADGSREGGVIPRDMPGRIEMEMIGSLGTPYRHISPKRLLPIVRDQWPSEMSSDDWIWGKWDLLYGFEAAVHFYDMENESEFVSGNYLTFSYTDAERWEGGDTEAKGLAYIALDKVEDSQGKLDFLLSDSRPTGFLMGGSYEDEYRNVVGTQFYPSLIRVEGYFEGNEFHPIAIDSVRYIDIDSGDEVRRRDKLQKLHMKGELKWNNLFALESPPERPTETIYAWNLLGFPYDYEPITVEGVRYDGLSELLLEGMPQNLPFAGQRGNLLESVIIRQRGHEDIYGRFIYTVAVRCWPLQYAILRMFPAYLVSFALVFIAIRLILRKWRKCITEPLVYLAYVAEDGHVYPSCPLDEIYRLETYVADTHQRQAETQNEIQQLRTALDYAKDAEEKRRQLISNITHELKTPLAVIHSYAEGLQSGIDAEKQEHYLSVILDESEHMDEMVLQMLDVSRLEAGKVRLSVDHFSLLQLTESVVEKFTPLMEEKELSFRYGLAEEFELTADEGRIRQVITNLISNALKYTSCGGRITVNIYVENRNARFIIANTAAHLSDEALLKVWDSFYRADPSRTELGTGLGLTLVKSIVELHRGVCYVRNTVDKTEETVEDAVEFGFTLPIK